MQLCHAIEARDSVEPDMPCSVIGLTFLVTLTDPGLIFKVTEHATLLRHTVALESVVKQLLSDVSFLWVSASSSDV